MSSWETTALRLQGNVTADSTPSSLDKSLPLLPKRNAKARTTTGVKEVSPEEKDYRTKGWKPLSLSRPILLAVIALTILLAIAVETITQRSAAQGGLALSVSLEDMPNYARFSYLYAPTVVAVLYSMIWSWIDLDVKRMQPWLELSKPNGATAEDSLFLDYQYDFVGSVPIKAAKRKHWPAFFGGTAMILVLWLLTPLQSTLLGTEVVSKSESTTIGNRTQLIPLKDQLPRLGPEILNIGYSIGWLGQPFPPFTAPNYTLLPFYIDNDPTPSKVHSNWTAETTMLSTELDCWPAIMEQKRPKSEASFNFLSGKGCNTTVIFPTNANYTMYYIGYHSSAYSDRWIANENCKKKDTNLHQFLALWSRPEHSLNETEPPDFNISAMFCRPDYYKQRVTATVEATTLDIVADSVQPLSPRETLPVEEFNSTAFEFLLGNGMADRPIVKDYPFNIVVEQQPRLNKSGLSRPLTNMVGFALAGRDLPVTDYASHQVMSKAYGDAHKYLFSVAVTKLLANVTQPSNTSASVEYALTGIVASRIFATTIESILAVIVVFTALLLWLCERAPNNLPANPSSLERYIDLFRHSPEVLVSMRRMDGAHEKALAEEFRHDQLKLFFDELSGVAKFSIVRVIPDCENADHRNPSTQKGYYKPIRPLPLKRESGFLFVLCLTGAVVGLSYLKQQEANLHGLHRPTDNFEVLQLLENYIPTIFATLVEPFWVLLNRLLCVLQPFRDLWKGKADSSHTIEANYTSIPPQLVLWRALKSKHFVLALLCVMALLSNLLAIGLGSLFNEAPTVANYTEPTQSIISSKFDNSSVYDLGDYFSTNLISTWTYQDHFYIGLANMSSGTPLPPWVSKNYYFQPFNVTKSGTTSATGDTYQLQTRGFGAQANCSKIPSFELPVYKSEISYWEPGGVGIPDKVCVTKNLIRNAGWHMRDALRYRTKGLSAFEFSNTLSRNTGVEFCDKKLTLGWARVGLEENVNGTVEASFMICDPIFETAIFNVTVDASGHILAYEKASALESTLGYKDSRLHTDIMFQHYNHQWNKGSAEWHNNTLTMDWINYFIFLVSGSRDAIDPSKPVPDPAQLAPVVEEVYRRLYALFLSVLDTNVFESASPEEQTTAIRSTRETRIFMEDASFIISVTVLAANILVATIFYCRTMAFVLPRMPTTLGSILAYIAASRLASPGFENTPGKAGRTFSFGRYIGLDGDSHIGIETDPHVVPINPVTVGEERSFLCRLRKTFFRKGKADKTEPWL
ncbi:uncharacterized protein FFFS_04190 [Fusarium fujikuroi]|nr:uncharacterized protein FFFS_04190 [Fusarium fujikuroi]